MSGRVWAGEHRGPSRRPISSPGQRTTPASVTRRYRQPGQAEHLLVGIAAPEDRSPESRKPKARWTQLRARPAAGAANRGLARDLGPRRQAGSKGMASGAASDTHRSHLESAGRRRWQSLPNIARRRRSSAIPQPADKATSCVVARFDGGESRSGYIDVGQPGAGGRPPRNVRFTDAPAIDPHQLFVPQDRRSRVTPAPRTWVAGCRKIAGPANFSGKVACIADALQPGSRTLLTRIAVAEPDDALSPGSIAWSNSRFREIALADRAHRRRSFSTAKA